MHGVINASGSTFFTFHLPSLFSIKVQFGLQRKKEMLKFIDLLYAIIARINKTAQEYVS